MSPSASSFYNFVVSSVLLKLFPIDHEEIIVGHIDVEGDSTEKVERVIRNTSIV
jgi:hypothetical protein